MVSIEVLYKKAQDENRIYQNSNLSAYACLTQAIKGRKFSRKSLVKAFRYLVPKDEYLKEEKIGLINYLEYLTNLAEEGEKQPKNRF